MTNKYLVSDEQFEKIQVAHRLRKLLKREKTVSLPAAHRRCGYGLTLPEFDEIVKELVNSGWCTTKTGKLGGVTLTFFETFNVVRLPEDGEVERLGERLKGE